MTRRVPAATRSSIVFQPILATWPTFASFATASGLRAAGLFTNKPQDGIEPKISFRQPDVDGSDTETANSGGRKRRMRGQSPDDAAATAATIEFQRRFGHSRPKPDPVASSPPRTTAGFGDPTASPAAGQVPLGQTGPSTLPNRNDAWRNPSGKVVPVQYMQPVPQAPPGGVAPAGRYALCTESAIRWSPTTLWAAARADRALCDSAVWRYTVCRCAGSPPPRPREARGRQQPPADSPAAMFRRGTGIPTIQALRLLRHLIPETDTRRMDTRAMGAATANARTAGAVYAGRGSHYSRRCECAAGKQPPAGYDSGNQLFPPNTYPLQPEEVIRETDVDVAVQEAQTGRFMIGVGVNSSAGLIGNISLDEQNFDWRRFPTSIEDIRNGTALRGGGQQFRISAMPGTQFSQYSATFREPYLMDSRVSFSLSGQYFMRSTRTGPKSGPAVASAWAISSPPTCRARSHCAAKL